jgi:hypothetical protein
MSLPRIDPAENRAGRSHPDGTVFSGASPRFSERQLAAIDRAVKRFRLDDTAAKRYFHTLYAATYEEAEVLLCAGDPQYFITEYCQIYDAQALDWIPFELWPEQVNALDLLDHNQFTIALKARQLGLTWLAIAYALWLMLFRPIATILLFSKREDEAVMLLSEERLRGMYMRLPEWMQCEGIDTDNKTQLKLSNGSIAYSFPTTGGDSYTATYVVVDEADLIPNFNQLMRSVRPTIDAGGKLFLVSRADKSKPESEFKKIYQAAKQGLNTWKAIFLPWFIRPERTQAWYDAQKQDILTQTGTLDSLREQYPNTDVEALSPNTLDKRIAPEWLNQCYREASPLSDALLREEKAPAIPGLSVYTLPIPKRSYTVGADPAAGNPNSDDSAAVVIDELTGEQVALLAGKFEPSVFSAHIDKIGTWFNRAAVLYESNNHGHACLLWARDHSKLRLLNGWDNNQGWLSNSKGKALLYSGMAEAARDKQVVIHSFKCFNQLSSIEGGSLRAPEGLYDDCADAFALAVAGRGRPKGIFVG